MKLYNIKMENKCKCGHNEDMHTDGEFTGIGGCVWQLNPKEKDINKSKWCDCKQFILEEIKFLRERDKLFNYEEEGCGKKIKLKNYHLYCGDIGMYKLRLCSSCSSNSHLKASFDNEPEIMQSSGDVSGSDIPLSDKINKIFESWLRFDDVRIKALNPETIDILKIAIVNLNKESIKRLKEEFGLTPRDHIKFKNMSVFGARLIIKKIGGLEKIFLTIMYKIYYYLKYKLYIYYVYLR